MHIFLGPRVPIQPSELLAVNITSYSATVQWVVRYIAYTEEQYTINYGTERESLDQSSMVISSSADNSASNISYDIFLQDLTPNTVYYFQLNSRNTQGETTSSPMTFTTLEAGKYCGLGGGHFNQ